MEPSPYFQSLGSRFVSSVRSIPITVPSLNLVDFCGDIYSTFKSTYYTVWNRVVYSKIVHGFELPIYSVPQYEYIETCVDFWFALISVSRTITWNRVVYSNFFGCRCVFSVRTTPITVPSLKIWLTVDIDSIFKGRCYSSKPNTILENLSILFPKVL